MTDLKIMAEPSREGESCRFTFESPIYENVAASFPTKESAAGSPLAEMIFALQGVSRVSITPNRVVVNIGEPLADWRPLAKEIAQNIRAHHVSGQPAVSPDKLGNPIKDLEIGKKVQDLIDTEINPGVGAHGGFVSLLDVKNGLVYLQLGGGCQGCGMADVTLKHGIETIFREKVPEVVGVIDQTDHAGGSNPYYSPGK